MWVGYHVQLYCTIWTICLLKCAATLSPTCHKISVVYIYIYIYICIYIYIYIYICEVFDFRGDSKVGLGCAWGPATAN